MFDVNDCPPLLTSTLVLVQKGEMPFWGPEPGKKKQKTKRNKKKHARTAPAKPESKSPLLVYCRTFKQQIKFDIFEMNSIWLR